MTGWAWSQRSLTVPEAAAGEQCTHAMWYVCPHTRGVCLMGLAPPAPQWYVWGQGSQCHCLCVYTHTHTHTHTHTLLYLLECALVSGCSSLPPSPEASENPSSVSEVNLFAVSTSAYESSEEPIDKCRFQCQKSCLEPKRLHTSALKA